MNKSKIEWCDMTWNPVTGCLHECEYCYARGIANRFKGNLYGDIGISDTQYKDSLNLHVLNKKTHRFTKRKEDRIMPSTVVAPYPFGFEPTFHKYRLDEPQKLKDPSNIFVCSMADLFGEWVPDEWIKEVFKACETAPQHRYLFLTKNPARYFDMQFMIPLLTSDRYWYGTTITNNTHLSRISFLPIAGKRFLSIEPLQDCINFDLRPVKAAIPFADWIIIGAETGNRKDKVIPKREWIENIVNQCRLNEIPIFMKNSLKELMGEDFIQQFPWG